MGTIITSNTELISDYLPKNNDLPIIIKLTSEKPVDDVFSIGLELMISPTLFQ